MKKIFIFVLLILFVSGCNKNYDNTNEDTLNSILLKKDFDCKDELSLYYTDANERKYYTVCLTEIILKYNNKEIVLKDELEKNPQVMDIILNNLTQIDIANDGGTTVYRDFGYSGFSDTAFTIIKCNAMKSITEDGNFKDEITYNKDFYFGDVNLEYKEGYCQD